MAGSARVDEQIRTVLTSLDERGLLANTVVVITAEHGVALNGDDSPATAPICGCL